VVPKPLSTNRSPSRTANYEPPPIEPPIKSPQRFGAGPSQPLPLNDVSIPSTTTNGIKADTTKPQEAGPKAVDEKPAPTEKKTEEQDEVMRPGLGRMFGGNKKTTKELFSKAASAYTAFKPRAGGAGAKLFAAAEPKSNEPDGITSVVPAPNLLRSKTNDSVMSTGSGGSIQKTPTSAVAQKKSIPDFTVTSPQTPSNGDIPVPSIPVKAVRSVPDSASKMSELQQRAAELQQKSKAAEEEAARRKLRRTPQQIKYLERLKIDPGQLEGRGLEYEALLEEFWPQNVWHEKSIEALQSEVRRELSRVQTGSWFEHIALHDEDRNSAIKLIDSAIDECEQLEKLLTIYSVELGVRITFWYFKNHTDNAQSLSDDIAYIEAQGQGLQVQTSNQKLLMSDLQDLLDIINRPQALDPIFNANVINIDGLEQTERAVLHMYKVLTLTDPNLKQNATSTSDQSAQSLELSKMRALQEKKTLYIEASDTFLKRFKNYMNIIYGQAMMEIQAASKKDVSKSIELTLSVESVNAGRLVLWKYSPLILYTKSLNRPLWRDIIKMYQSQIRTIYSNGIVASIQATKKLSRGSPGDEQDILFTSEAQADSIAATALKLTAKRSQHLARSWRTASGDKTLRQPSGQTGSLYPCEGVDQALSEITPLILSEQMFLVDFFHATTTEVGDFADAVLSSVPENRRGPVDLQRKPYEPDQEMTQFVTDTMADLFSFLPNELDSLIKWALAVGQLQGVGVLYALHSKMATIEDGFYFRALHSLSTRLTNEWSKFLNSQIRAIEETKVKVNKRKGILHFMRIFPVFSAHIESMLPPANTDLNEVRTLVDEAYRQIIKAMFDSLRAIAKETPSASQGPSGDPEDKEALNYHILLIENTNHYVEHVDPRGDQVLEEGKQKALEQYEEHLSLYVDAVIRRPLGKIMVSLFSI
jgi:exocyst complex component 1